MTEVVILANSFKVGGRCVAGVTLDDHRWVRPVSARPGRELTVAETVVNRDGITREVRPGDVVEMTIGGARPTPYHPEDVSYVRGWLFRRTMEPDEIADRLAPVIATGGQMLGWPGKALDPASIVPGQEHPSLELRLVENSYFSMNPYDDKKLRVLVDGLDLSVTDMSIHNVDFANKFISSALVTVSLAEPFRTQPGRTPLCYKLVAAVLPL